VATLSWEIPSIPLPFSERGPYQVSFTQHHYQDTTRDNRTVSISIWYPVLEGNPDLRGAPYPLIVSSTQSGNYFAQHLVSHGFAYVGVNQMGPYDPWGMELIDYPLDLLFVLDQIATNPPEKLQGVIDTERVGTMGYSFGGYNALALSGARVDPAYYAMQCAHAPTMEPMPAAWWIEYICAIDSTWEAFAAHAGAAITTSEDGLWQPMTDDRIKAVIPMAPEGAWLFGERGLETVDRPIMMFGATDDDLNYYGLEAVYIYEHLGTPDGIMISFVGAGHMMIFDANQVKRMKHFVTAFYGYHLQGREDYAGYFSKDYVSQQEGLSWGVYSGAGTSPTQP
jgi:predicted dienelactone hydrolase